VAEEEPGFIGELRRKIGELTEYDSYALAVYGSLSFYLAQRSGGTPQPQAAQATCKAFGHDSPRGLCLRCGLGQDPLATRQQESYAELLAKRNEWLKKKL
jgi:hypothetical protein